MKNKLPNDFNLTRYNAFIRLVNTDDAEFIVNLRGNYKKSKFIHTISADVKDQEIWIKNYKERESNGEEYYFIVCDNQRQAYGTTRIYNFNKDTFETGSWVFMDQSPDGLPVIGDILGREIAFENLGFSTCKFEVRKGNLKVLKYHRTYKPTLVREDDLNFYFELNKQAFYDQRNNILKLYGYGI